jgi:hypothetical protein
VSHKYYHLTEKYFSKNLSITNHFYEQFSDFKFFSGKTRKGKGKNEDFEPNVVFNSHITNSLRLQIADAGHFPGWLVVWAVCFGSNYTVHWILCICSYFKIYLLTLPQQ